MSSRPSWTSVNVQYTEKESVESCIAEADVIYMEPVVQADYTVSRDEATEDKGLTPAAYRVTRELLREKAKSDAIILHSLPRMDELPPDVDSTRHARYWVEAFNGVVMRMALLVAHPRRDRVGESHADTSTRPGLHRPPGVHQGRARHADRRRLRPEAGTGPSASRTPICATRCWPCCSSSRAPAPAPPSRPGWPSSAGTPSSSSPKTTQIAHGDTAKEIGEILGRYNDGIAIRQCDWGTGNKYIRDVAEASRVPVLNMQCDIYHPHQALADIMTIIEHFGDPRGKTATVSWAHAPSYSEADQRGAEPRAAAAPLRHEPASRAPAGVQAHARHRRARPRRTPVKAHASFEIIDDFDEGFKGTDVVYAKSWGALVTTTGPGRGQGASSTSTTRG